MGLGSFWDPNDHPRGWHGRFAKKWKISDALRGILDHFSPRTFQSDSQAGQYAFNLGHKNGPFSSVELTRLRKDWDEASDHLRAGDMDPQTKAFDDMMQSHMHPTTEGLIATTTFGPDALGLRPDQMRDGPGGITDLFGTVLGNKGYQAVHLGNDVTAGQHGPGKISATILVPAGTRAAFPGQSPNDRGFFLDKEQPLLITRVDPDGMGGWRIAAVAEPHPGTGSSEVSQDLNPGRKGVGLTPEQRAARLAEPSTMPAPAAPPAAPATEAVMRPESVQAPAVARTPEQEAARVARAQAGRQASVNEGNAPVQAPLPTPNPREAPAPPAAGPTPPTGAPPRNEPIHAPSIGGTGTEGKSASEIANTPPPPPEAPPVLSPAEQGQSLKDAYVASGIESPAAGPHRAAFNRAYLRAKSPTGHPEQALRDLEKDIKGVEQKAAEQKIHPSDRPDMATAEADAKSMNDLADLIATHFGLPRSKKEEAPPKSPVQRAGGPDEFLGGKKPGAREAAGVSGQPSKTATGLTPHEQAGSGPGTAGVGGRKEGAPETPAPRGSTGKETTQKATVSAARVQNGDVVLARKNENGEWVHTSTKTGATPVTVTRKSPGAGGTHVIEGTDPEGNKITLNPIRGQNVLHRHQEKAPKAPAAKKAAKAAAPKLSHDEIAKRSAEMLARPASSGGGKAPEPLTEADHREMLSHNSKDQLQKIGEDLGVQVSSKDSKASMIDKIAPAAAADTAKRAAERAKGAEAPAAPNLEARQTADTAGVDRVLKAYNDIVARGDGHDRRVSIADIRAEVGGDLSRAELTRALREIGRGGSTHGGLLSRGVKPDARTEANGMDMGGEKVHFLQLPRPGEAGRGGETTPNPKEVEAAAKAAPEVSSPVEAHPSFDAKKAKTFSPVTQVKHADIIDAKPGEKTTITPEWGGEQHFVGPWVAVKGEDGKVAYGSALSEWKDMHERVPGTTDGWQKTATVDAYQHTGAPTKVSTVLADGTVETENTVNPGDWVVKQKNGEVQIIRDDKFRKLYDVEAPTTKAPAKKGTAKPEAVDAAKKAYEDIVGRRGPDGDRKVSLQDIRQELELQHNFTRSEVDAALKELGRGGSEHGGLISGTNAPSAREKAGAMKMGGEDVHFLQLPRPGEAARGAETTPNAPEAPTPAAPAAAAERPLEKMTKAELLAHPDAEGAKKSWTKGQILQHIQDRQGIGSAVAERPKAVEPAKPTTTLTDDLKQAGVGEVSGSQAEALQKAMEGPDTRESLLERANALQDAADKARARSINLGTTRGEDGALLPSAKNQAQSRQEGADAARLEKAAQVLRQRADVGHVSDLSTDPQERQKQIINRVNKAYEDLKGKSPSGLVRLADLRDRVGSDVSREEMDKLLAHLMQLPEVDLSPDSNQKFATDRERAAATHFGNQRQDLIHIRNGVTAEDLHTGVAHIQAGGHPEEAPGHKRLMAEEKKLHGAKAIRPTAPIDNEPRANEFTKAWDAAGIPEAPGLAGRSMKEIRKDVAEGKIDPTEGIRRMESEVSFNKDELSQVEADLRAPDLTEKQRMELMVEHDKLVEGIQAQEKASSFMRAHFGGKGDAPTVAEVKDKLPATFGDRLKAAKPEEMDEVARIQGLDPPKGDTAEEKFDDLIRQTVQKELDSRQAAKVEKAAKAEAARIKKEAREAGKAEFRPGGAKHLDAAKIAEGLGLDGNNSYLNDAQAELNDGKTPKQVADRLRFMARGLADSNAIINGSVGTGNETPDDKMHRETRLAEGRATVAKLEELATRIEASKRPRKPRTPSTKLTPTDHAAAREAAKATGTPVAEVRSAMEDAKKADAKLQELGIPTSVDELHARAIARASAPFNDAKTAEEAQKAATRMHADLTLAEIRKMGAEHGITGRSKKDITDKIIARRFPPETQMERDMKVLTRGGYRNDGIVNEHGQPGGFTPPPRPRAKGSRPAGPDGPVVVQEATPRTGFAVPPRSTEGRLTGGQFDQLKAGDAIEVHLGGSKTRKDSVAKVDPDGTLHTKGGYKYGPTSDVQVSKAGAPSAPSVEAVRQAQISESETKLKAAARADELQRAKQASEVVSEVHELVANGASAQAIRHRLDAVGQANKVDTGELQDLADDPKALLKAADEMGASAGLTRVGRAGSTVAFKNGTHEPAGALEMQNGSPARVTRPGHTVKLSNGEQVTISRPKVHPVSAEPAKKAAPTRLAAAKKAAKGTGPAAEPRLSPEAEKARLEQERADNMARLAVAKAIKKATPAKAPTKKVRFTEAAAEKQFGPRPGEARIEAGKFSDKPFREQTWGGRAQTNDIRFHEDGAIGSALDMMGNDQRLDVGGEPLRNVLGQIATDVNRGTITPAQGLERYKALAARLPRDTKARQELERAIERIDSPPRKPNLPEGTPPFLRKLAERLAEIPIARQPEIGRTGRKGELDQVEELARELTNGEPKSMFTAHEALSKLMGNRHESSSDAGHTQIMAAIRDALREDEEARAAARKARQKAQQKE